MAAEVLRICTAPGGAPVLDLADGQTYSYVPDSLQIDPGTGGGASSSAGTTTWQTSPSDERYGGSSVDWEQRANATISWQAVISAPQIGTGVANLAAEVERADPPNSRYVEWCPAGYTNSGWFERRGPGTWQAVERWDTGEISVVQVTIPVSPVKRGAPITLSPSALSLPAVFPLPGVPGTLWAELDFSASLPAGGPLQWALLGPFQGGLGVANVVGATTSGNWSAVVADGTARGGNVLRITPAAAGTTYSVTWTVTPPVVNADEMERDYGLEVWVRVRYDPTLLIAPILTASAAPLGVGAAHYPVDFGPTGRQFGAGPSGAAWFLHRVGLFHLGVDATSYAVTVAFTPGPGSSGALDVDYALFAPGRWRACSPTGIPRDGSYPAFQPSTGAVIKTIRHDLTGLAQAGGGATHQDTGLGGAPLYVPPGSSSLLVAASSTVPDDPSSVAGGDVLGPSISPVLTLTPRYRLMDAI